MSQTVHFQGNPVTVANVIPQAGSKAQAFTLVAKDLSDVSLSQYAGKRKVLNIFPSIDTGVCAASVRKFNQLATEVENTVVLCVSADLPFAQSRFCGAEGLSNVITLSTLRNNEFLKNYGVEIVDGPLKGLAARAVIVLDENDNVIFSQLVDEITHEPDYDAALNVLKAQASACWRYVCQYYRRCSFVTRRPLSGGLLFFYSSPFFWLRPYSRSLLAIAVCDTPNRFASLRVLG